MKHDGAARTGNDGLVCRSSNRRLLEPDLLDVDAQIAREDLGNRIGFEQPAGRREHRLLFPFRRRPDSGEADRDALD